MLNKLLIYNVSLQLMEIKADLAQNTHRHIGLFLLPYTNQTFLRNGCYQHTLPVVHAGMAQSSRAGGIGALHGEQQPFIHAERTVKPDYMIKASDLQALITNENAMRLQRSPQQPVIGDIGKQRFMRQTIVR